MISYLLSGWRVFVPDANGQPLYRGRVYFYDASTSEPSAVYQEKEKVTSLGTYVDVDNNGFLPAIWLDADHLYKCVVKRLIQQDPETWQTMWEIDDVGNPFITAETDDGSSMIMVNDITLLRAIDVTSDERPDYVSVAGWFNPGDTGSPMVFLWREGEVHNEDGHWVKPSSSASLGTWEQILDDELDPRKFGAIPDTGNAVDSALVNCMRYACEPHVHDVSDPTVYKPRTVKFVRSGNYKLNGSFDFSNYHMNPYFDNVPVPVVVGDGVFFDGPSVEFGKGSRIESSQKISDNFIINDPQSMLRTSWFGNGMNIAACSSRVVVIDDASIGSLFPTTLPLTGRVVINLLDALPSNLMLTDCVVIDAHDGSLAPTLLKLGEYNVSHGTNGDGEHYAVVKSGNTEYFKFRWEKYTDRGGNVHYRDIVESVVKMLLTDGFKVPGGNAYLEIIDGNWNFRADTVTASFFGGGTFVGNHRLSSSYNYCVLELLNDSASATVTVSKNLNLISESVGYIVIPYRTAGGNLVGNVTIPVENDQSVTVTISIFGSSSSSVGLPIDPWQIVIPVMRINDQVFVDFPRRMDVPRSAGDTDLECHILVSTAIT